MGTTIILESYDSVKLTSDESEKHENIKGLFRRFPVSPYDIPRMLSPVTAVLDRADVDYHIAGGAIVALLNDDDPRDIDVFFENEEDYSKMIEHLRSMGYKSLSDLYETDKSLGMTIMGRTIDFVKKDRGSNAKAVISDFDFIHCKMAYSPKTREFTFHTSAPGFLLDKKIAVDWEASSLDEPYRTIDRVVRYVGRGFSIERDDLLAVSRRMNEFEGDVPDTWIRGSG